MASKFDDKSTGQVALRILDVADEPLEFFRPIVGYADSPAVALEEAIKELVSIVPHVGSFAYTAKQNSRNPVDGLTSDESAAIRIYTMAWDPPEQSLYHRLNHALRSKADRQENIRPWYPYLRLLVSGLSRLPVIQKTVFRGIKGHLAMGYGKGETIVWWGFSSCTTSLEVLQSEIFFGNTEPRTMFIVECKAARDIRNHSEHASEKELLLLPGTVFKVMSCLDQGGRRDIHLMEVIPDHPLLQSIPVESQSVTTSMF